MVNFFVVHHIVALQHLFLQLHLVLLLSKALLIQIPKFYLEHFLEFVVTLPLRPLIIIGKTKSAIFQNEKYIFCGFRALSPLFV